MTIFDAVPEMEALLEKYPTVVAIGRKKYEITCVITGGGKLILECEAVIGRPTKYASAEEAEKARKEKQRKYNQKSYWKRRNKPS